MLSRAARLSSASTTHQGASGMSVCTNISSLAREKSTQRSRVARSFSENFHAVSGSAMRSRKRRSCSSSLTENQYLRRRMPSSTSIRSKVGHWCRKRRYSCGRAVPHHPLDAGAVVPGPVEQGDLAGRRQLLDVPLEVPLGPLALRRRRQRDDAGHPRVEVLRDPLDGAALAGGVAALEDDDQPLPGRGHPLLQGDELGLQPQELALVGLARHPLGQASQRVTSSTDVVNSASASGNGSRPSPGPVGTARCPPSSSNGSVRSLA